MTMTKTVFIASLSLLALALPVQAGNAELHCGPDAETLRLTLSSPFGCVTDQLFKKQIDQPSDLKAPRAETAPDTKRRIHSLTEWRLNKSTQGPTQEAPK